MKVSDTEDSVTRVLLFFSGVLGTYLQDEILLPHSSPQGTSVSPFSRRKFKN